ncbi:MAG: OmpA family protein, partial [Proteobacteria bacterium]|nr:OmpA family protein [Pseudomonadota bacterium]
FFYFDLAANSGGFSGGGGNHEFFDSCVHTKIADRSDKPASASVGPNAHDGIRGEAAPPSVQGAGPASAPKLAAKPEPSEVKPPTPSAPSSAPVSQPEAPSITAEAKAGNKDDRDLAAIAPAPMPAPSPMPEPEKNTAEPLPAAPSPSLAAAPPPSTQPTTVDQRDAPSATKQSEQTPEPLPTVEPQRNAIEQSPVTPPPSVAASPPANAQAATAYAGAVSDEAKPPTAQSEPNAGSEPEKKVAEPPATAPPPTATTATADAPPPPASPSASNGTEEKPSLAAAPSPPGGPAVATAPAVESCVATLENETHGATITFANSSAIISNESVAELRKIAEIARGCARVAIEVGGHTDNFGSRLGNRELSQRRADAVVGILIGAGVSAEKLKAIGYGQDQPIASNATAAGRRLNRRVEFHIAPAKTSG